MGAPMIRHLLHAGHSVHVWNRTRAKAEALRAEGAHVVDTPRELAARCDAVLLCVADAAAVEQIVFGPAGLLDGGPAAPRRMGWIVDHSSIPPAATRALARRVADFGEAGGAADGAAGERLRDRHADAGRVDGPAIAATGCRDGARRRGFFGLHRHSADAARRLERVRRVAPDQLSG